MSDQVTQPNTPHHQRAIWPMLGFAILAILFVVAILAFGDDSGESGESLTAVPESIEAFCPPQQEEPDFDLTEIIGEDFDDAEEWATENGNTLRPIVIDGEPLAVTLDYREERINVAVEDDEVVAYCGNY